MADHALLLRCCFYSSFFCILIHLRSVLLLTEGATQSFYISGLDSISGNNFSLREYGDMEAYYLAHDFKGYNLSPASNCTLAFINPALASSNSSFILVSLVTEMEDLEMGAIVWMANRHRPVSRDFTLLLDQSLGNLILLDGDRSFAWSTNLTSPRNGKVSMDLTTNYLGPLPIGTLILSDSANTTIWRSSDHPTDTLVSYQVLQPGMSLVSWASVSDPSGGLYRLVMEAGGLALYYHGYPASPMPYWFFTLYRSLSKYAERFLITHTCIYLTQAFMGDGDLVLNLSKEKALERSTSSDLCAATDGIWDSSLIPFQYYGSEDRNLTILSLEYDGNLLAYTAGSSRTYAVFDLFRHNKCLLPSFCGPYGICSAPSSCACPVSSDDSFPSTFPSDYAQGCPPKRNLSCLQHTASTTAASHHLLKFVGVDYFLNSFSASSNLTSLEACRDACLQNCPCLMAFWHEHSKSCFHIKDFVSSLQGSLNSSYIAFLKVETPNSKKRSRLVIALVSGGFAMLILGILVAATVIYYRKVYGAEDNVADEDKALWTHIPGLPRRFSYKDLQSITSNFSEQIGKGGFGTVYAGTLQDGIKVAVKRLESLRQGAKEFRAEVVILGRVHHYNLVQLVGYCAEGSIHRLLVYQYMAKGSLDKWLFTSKDLDKPTIPLPWSHRFNIALGAARGLAYLHEACNDTVLHLDIKPQNILLDDNFVAKVSDFGLSTLMGRDESHVMTTMRGTPGYLAPEWLAEGSEISPKCDVFSYGKLLMELLGSRKNLDPSLVEEQEKLYFPAWLYLRMTLEGGAQEAELKHIAGVETLEEMVQAKMMMKTAFLCVLKNPSQRPSMETVVQMLEGRVSMLKQLNLSDLFQGLQFALSLVDDRIDKVLAFTLDSPSCPQEYAHGSQGVAHSVDVSAR